MSSRVSLKSLLAVCAAFTLSASCVKKPNLKDDDGTPVSASSVQAALVEGWGEADPAEILKNEFAYTEKRYTLADMPSRLVLQDAKNVQTVSDDPADDAYKIYKILQQVAEITDDNQQKLSTSERNIRVPKALEPLTRLKDVSALNANPALPLGIETVQSLLLACVPAQDWDVSCFNLRTWDETEDAPPLISERPGCEGLPNCKVRKKVIAFDLVVEMFDPDTGTRERSKAIYTVKISPDAPYLSRLTDFCYQGLGTSQGQSFPLTVCQTIRNFRRGTP